MKSILSVSLATLMITVGAASAGTPVKPKDIATTDGAYSKGRLFFPELEFDFGIVPQDAAVSHSFWLVNKGTDTLEIIQIKPG